MIDGVSSGQYNGDSRPILQLFCTKIPPSSFQTQLIPASNVWLMRTTCPLNTKAMASG